MGNLVSVILPVYKVEDYLDKCMESIVEQTYRELEIILVDDGSPDRCPELCDAWAARDSRVRVLHKSNGGVGEARNSGMEIAKGSYLMFVDSDDALPPDAVQVLLERLTADGSDLAVGKYLPVYPDGRFGEDRCAFFADLVLSGDDFLTRVGNNMGYPVGPCGKLYRRKIMEGIRFPRMTCAEDMWVFPLIVQQCALVSVVARVVYYYNQNPTSAVHTMKDKQNLESITSCLHMVDIFLQRGQTVCAAVWFGNAVEYIQELREKQTGIDLVRSHLSGEQLTRILEQADRVARTKWWLLRHPGCYRAAFGVKRQLERWTGRSSE